MHWRGVALAASGLIMAVAMLWGPADTSGGPGLVVGASEDMAKWDPAEAASAGNDLGLGAFRLTVTWQPGQKRLQAAQAELLEHAISSLRRQRIVLAVYGAPGSAPVTDVARNEYCTFVENLLVRYSQIDDVVVWNEPNKSSFWRAQYGHDGSSIAPSRYAQLLAACYPLLHQVRPNVNVIAALGSRGGGEPGPAGSTSTSPVRFIEGMRAAYRRSGMRGRLFDVFGQNVYRATSAEPPSQKHGGGTIGEGDYAKLVGALDAAFGDTGQPPPGEQGVSIWYMEDRTSPTSPVGNPACSGPTAPGSQPTRR